MIQRTFKVTSKEGLHARPASLLCQEATRFQGTAEIIHNGVKNTLKSIMVVMSLGVAHNEEFTIILDGENENEMLIKIEEVLKVNEII